MPSLHRESPHSLILMMKNHKNFRFLSGGRNGFPALSGRRNVSVDLKCDVLCLWGHTHLRREK